MNTSYWLDIGAFAVQIIILIGIATSLYRWRGFPSGMLVASTKLVRIMLWVQVGLVVNVPLWILVAHLRLKS